jgi:hypothetical protein
MVRQKSGTEILYDIVMNHFGGHLFHRTDHAHLSTIDELGLLSTKQASFRNIIPPFPGGNALTRSLDFSKGLDDMVFLSFFNKGLMPNHDDAKRRRPITLAIDPRVLYLQGVQVALGRASLRRTKIYRPGGALYKMDWDIIEGLVDENSIGYPARFNTVCDYEILIPAHVPREFILGTV